MLAAAGSPGMRPCGGEDVPSGMSGIMMGAFMRRAGLAVPFRGCFGAMRLPVSVRDEVIVSAAGGRSHLVERFW